VLGGPHDSRAASGARDAERVHVRQGHRVGRPGSRATALAAPDVMNGDRTEDMPHRQPHGSTAARLLAAVLLLSTTGLLRSGGTTQAQHQNATPPDLRTISLFSPALGGETSVRLLLPDRYATGRRRYPVLYLLHGLTGSERDWASRSDVVALARRLPLIVVMPAGGNGWYADPLAPAAPHWESYHIGELIPYMDRHYRTISGRAGRAIAGLSMGGLGALAYAARHPDLFVAAAAFSGVDDLRTLQGVLLSGAPFIFGDPSTQGWRWSGHNPVELATNLRGLRLFLASGTGQPGPFDAPGQPVDGVEQFVHTSFTHMVAALRRAGVPALTEDYGAGTHSWPYWQRDLHHALPVIMAAFAHPPAPPASWSYRTTDSTFMVWGYTVQHRGAVPGWTVLSTVARGQITASGSGALVVTTASLYQPNTRYTLVSPGGGRQTLRADRSGHLRVTLTLGAVARTWYVRPGEGTSPRQHAPV